MKNILKTLAVIFLVTGFWLLCTTTLSAQPTNEGDGDYSLIGDDSPLGPGDDDDDTNTGNGGNGPNPGDGGGPNDEGNFWEDWGEATAGNDGGDSGDDNGNEIYLQCQVRYEIITPTNSDGSPRFTVGPGEEAEISVSDLCSGMGISSWTVTGSQGAEPIQISPTNTAHTYKINVGQKLGQVLVVLTFSGSTNDQACSGCPNTKRWNFVVICPTLFSETVAIQPTNRQRTKVGLGEEIKVNLIANTCGMPTWSVNNILSVQPDGTNLSPDASYNDGMIKAGFIPGKFEIKAVFGTPCSATCPESEYKMEFNIVAPNNIVCEPVIDPTYCSTGGGIGHTFKKPSVWAKIRTYFMPVDVNFYNIEVKEGDAPPLKDGDYFTNFPVTIPAHPSGDYIKCLPTVISGKGTMLSVTDEVLMAFQCTGQYSALKYGKLTYNIPNYYKRTVNGVESDVEFGKFPQSFTNRYGEVGDPDSNVNPKGTLGKGGITLTKKLISPNNCSSTICN